MTIFVINSGSSSIKTALFNNHSLERLIDIRVNDIGGINTVLNIEKKVSIVSAVNHSQALTLIFDALLECGYDFSEITAVGHRVLHGGEKLVDPIVINDDVEQVIESMNHLAPLHNPACLAGIRAARKVLEQCPHVAVFDTGFHSTLPTRAKIYALSNEVSSTYQMRKFGFHGISHEYVSEITAKVMKTSIKQLRIISCHLGNGCSMAAVESGRSVETSMGMTPLEGLVMGTRCGDLDPGIAIELLRDRVADADELDTLLNQQSGLLGMTGTNDMSVIQQRAAEGDEPCRRAIQVFTHRARKYIGAYTAAMGGVDAIVFTGGIGENSALIRHRIVQRFDYLGAALDEDRNREAKVKTASPVVEISTSASKVKLFVVATDEERAIASSLVKALQNPPVLSSLPPIPLAVSARHIHLTEETIQALFGPGYLLTHNHSLSQPGQFASQETVTLVGPHNRIDGVRVLGPARANNQIEISRSDEFVLGIDAPIRASGDTDNTPGITLIGPAGQITLHQGVICALRHIHMHPDDANQFNLKDGDLVDVAIESDNRVTFGGVLVRVNKYFRLEMHIDTDEAYAAGFLLNSDSLNIATLIKTDQHAHIIGL